MPIQLSLTDLVDIVSTAGSPKITKVREIKNRPAYSPLTDFYKAFREGVVEIHRVGGPRSDVKLLANQPDAKKQVNYPDLVTGYHKWWGNKILNWFPPPFAVWSAHGVDVRVNPELGLNINGHDHLVKLYNKDAKLTKLRIDAITHLMSIALSQHVPAGTQMSVLDVRNSKLFTLAAVNPI